MSQGTVLVTGATGYLGQNLCRFLHGRGYRVRAMVRGTRPGEAMAGEGIGEIYRCDLPHEIDEQAFQGDVAAVIHCAYETRYRNLETSRATNVIGARELLRLARAHGAGRFIFISSLSADPEVRSYYGQSKLEVERMLDSQRDLAIRPGLILGQGGLFMRMRRLVRAIPVIPVFYGGRQIVQTVWVEELCDAIEKALRKGLTGIVKVAEPEGVQLIAFYKAICELEGRGRLLVPFPGKPVLFGVRALEQLGFSPPISSENLLGLKALKHHDVRGDLARLGVTISPFAASLRQLAHASAVAP
jgi:nucleoside-diphosphate-sugar epimerase